MIKLTVFQASGSARMKLQFTVRSNWPFFRPTAGLKPFASRNKNEIRIYVHVNLFERNFSPPR
jgi:hypothetical protein